MGNETDIDRILGEELRRALTEGDIKPLATFYAYSQEDIDRLGSSINYELAINDLETYLREVEKYNLDKFQSPDDLIEAIRTTFYEIKCDRRLP